MRIFLIISFIILTTNNKTYSQTEFYPVNTLDVRLFGGKSSATNYFDIEGKSKFTLPDNSLSEELEKKEYIFEYDEYNFTIRPEYSLTEDLVIFAELPLNYHSLLERRDTTIFIYNPPDTTAYESKIIRADMSLLQPAYYSLGARYRIYSQLAFMALTGEIRIPPGFHNGIHNDPEYEFLSDGAFEILGGMILGARFEKGWMESHIMYRYRAEELQDELYIHTEAGLSTVPGSGLMIFFDILQSMGNYNNAVLFEPRKTTIQENMMNGGVKFKMFLTDTFYIDFSYALILTGKNTMNKNGYLLGMGFRI